MSRAPRRRTLVAVALLGAGVLAGCTASPAAVRQHAAQGQTAGSAPVSSAAPAVSVGPASATSTPAAPSSTSAARKTSAASTKAPAAPLTSAAPRSTCTNVTIRVIRGSAAQGIEFAALQFTNAGTKACELYGYPMAALRLRGRQIGQPAQPANTATSAFKLTPGGTAESRLVDYVNCQAPLSDSVRVVVPGSTIHTVRPAQLRACVLRVGKLGQPE